MKTLREYITENRGDNIDEQWINDEKPVMTANGNSVIITKVDYEEVPNIIYGSVKIKDKLYEFQWLEDGTCSKATDQYGNPKQPDKNDKLVKAI